MNRHQQLKDIYDQGNFVILDTETTGIKGRRQILSIAILHANGTPLLNRYVKNQIPIPMIATNIHGIKAEHLVDADSWHNIKPIVLGILRGKDVIVYNADYDRDMLGQTDECFDLVAEDYHKYCRWHCAMLWYADFMGDWDDYHQNNRWHKLTAACVQQNVPVKDAHGALADCRMTLALMEKVFAIDPPKSWIDEGSVGQFND